MFWLFLVTFLLGGIALIVLGGIFLCRRKYRERGAMAIRTPFGSLSFSGMGATGIVCIVIGAALLWIGADLAYNAGRDSQLATALTLVSIAEAQEIPQTNEGWVYAPEGSFAGNDIMRAQRYVPLRDNHFGDFTGTLVGKVLGYGEPDVVGEVQRGECVRVDNRTIVGFGKVWMKVQKVECQ